MSTNNHLSAAKLAANRDNAQHSTGPQTEEGKAKSAQNARQHGLCGGQLFIPAGAEDEFASLSSALFEEVRPVGELQMQFFEQLVHASWNTQIARRYLASALAQLDDKRINLGNRYLAQHERSFAKALKELKSLQTDLALRAIEQNEPIHDLPITCQVKVITAEVAKLTKSQASKTTGADAATEQTHAISDRWLALSRIGAAFRLTPTATTEKEQNEAVPHAA